MKRLTLKNKLFKIKFGPIFTIKELSANILHAEASCYWCNITIRGPWSENASQVVLNSVMFFFVFLNGTNRKSNKTELESL